MRFDSIKPIVVIDDINSSNINQIQSFIDNCDIRITTKLSMPSYEYSSYILNQLKEQLNGRVFSGELIKSIMGGALSEELRGIECTEGTEDLVNAIFGVLAKYVTNQQSLPSILGKIFWWLSHSELKHCIYSRNQKVFIGFTPSEHELYLFLILSTLGTEILIYDKGYKIRGGYGRFNGNPGKCGSVELHKQGTSEDLPISISTSNSVTSSSKDQSICRLEEFSGYISTILSDTPIENKVLISGYNKDTDNFLIDIKNKSGQLSNLVLIQSGLEPLSATEVSTVPLYSISPKSLDSLANKIGKHMFNNREYSDSAVDYLKSKILGQQDINIAKRKAIEFICCTRRYNWGNKTIVIFGPIKSQFTWFLDFLSHQKHRTGGILVFDYTGNSKSKLGGSWEVLEASNICEAREFPVFKVTNTVAFNASEEINTTLYGDSSLIGRERQCIDCQTSVLNTTFEELKLLWKEDNTYRDGFSIAGDMANIPVIYTSILGLSENHNETIHKLITEHTILCKTLNDLNSLVESQSSDPNRPYMKIHNLTDINGTMFSEQVPFYKSGKVQVEAILNARNFPYRNISKQKSIVNKVAFMIENRLITKPNNLSDIQWINEILSITLNLGDQFKNAMQWYDYPKQSPKLLINWNDSSILQPKHLIIIEFLHLCGWDVLISSVNGNDINNSCNQLLTHSILSIVTGEYKFGYELNFDAIGDKKKTSLFSWLFK